MNSDWFNKLFIDDVKMLIPKYSGDSDNDAEYVTLYATPQQYGAKGDGITDDTAAINECLVNNSLVYIPNGTYRIDAAIGVKPRSNQVIQMDAHAVLKGDFTSTSNGGAVVNCTGLENVAIHGGNIVGDKSEYPNDTDTWKCAGVVITKSKNVMVDSCRIYGHRGDGLAAYTFVEEVDYLDNALINIRVTNCEIYNCSRHGMWIDGIDGFLAENVEIHDCNTFAYSCAIDFEMHYAHNKMYNIKLERLTSYNTSLGLQCSQITVGAYENFELNNCVLDRFCHDFDEDIEIHNNRIERFIHSRKGILKAHNCKIAHMNFSENSGLAYFYKCHFENDREGILGFAYSEGLKSEADVTFEKCTFVTYTFAEDETAYIVNGLAYMSSSPTSVSFDDCVFYINNPNPTLLCGGVDNVRMVNCYMYIDFDFDGTPYDLFEFGKNCTMINNVFDARNASWTGSNKFLLTAGSLAENILLSGNTILTSPDSKYVYPIYNKTAGSTLTCINNVCRDYRLQRINSGIDAENVNFTNIGMITADTTA